LFTYEEVKHILVVTEKLIKRGVLKAGNVVVVHLKVCGVKRAMGITRER
jgi:hypothetical protein